MTKKNIESWERFRKNGLLWFINTILHLFGYVIVFDYKDGELKNVYPKRVPYRGFSEKDNTQGYIDVSKYLEQNATFLLYEAKN